jgi:hypothetical protein
MGILAAILGLVGLAGCADQPAPLIPPEKDEELRAARAEADKLDPGWRIKDLEAKRKKYPDAQNGALCVSKAYSLMPKDWKFDVSVQLSRLRRVPPQQLISRDEAEALADGLDEVRDAITEARRLTRLPNGHHPIKIGEDTLPTTSDHCPAAGILSTLLAGDSARRAQGGDLEGALVSCRAALNAARSLGDEAGLAQIPRASGVRNSVLALERILAQGQLPAQLLAETQQRFEEESRHAMFLIMLRGERAFTDWYLGGLRTKTGKAVKAVDSDTWKGLPGKGEKEKTEALARLAARSHAHALRYRTRQVEIAKLPAHQWKVRLKALQAGNDGLPKEVARLVSVNLPNCPAICQHHLAVTRCAAAGLAVERFRLANGRWPKSLEELQPKYLRQVPRDPFDGRQLRYRRTEEGVAVFSVGENEKDDGKIVIPFHQPGEAVDYGFQLWDVKKRRQPAKESADQSR